MRTCRRALATAVVAALFPACAGDDGNGTDGPASSSASVSDGPDGFTPDPIDWVDCGEFQCATVEVPVDYAAPDGDRFSVYVSRVPATGDRTGALFVNPGGPGATATAFAQGLAAVLPGSITDQFDLVAVEPRGVAGSGSIDCGMSAEELYAPDPSIDDDADRAALVDVSMRYTAGCLDHTDDAWLSHVGTREVARDIDAVRAAMGEQQVSYLGVSYGTVIGQVYAQLFPHRVRAMALDGVVELGPTGLEGARAQALGFELALERWAAACRADDSCPVQDDPIGALDAVAASSERPGGIAARARTAGPSDVNLAVGHALYTTVLWGDLAAALDAALGGDGSGLVLLADDYLSQSDTDVYFAVNCVDDDWPRGDPDAVLAEAKAVAAVAPHLGEAVVSDYVRCALWPVPAHPLAATSLPDVAPILVISTTGDPATPYEAGVRLADALDDAALLTHDGDGHGSVGAFNECIDDALAAYVVDLELPVTGTVCAG